MTTKIVIPSFLKAITTVAIFVSMFPGTHQLISSSNPGKKRDISSRIVGGVAIEPNEFPWLVYVEAIQTLTYAPMNGALITNRCILTETPTTLTRIQNYNVVLGSSDKTDVHALKYFKITDFASYPYQGEDRYTATIIILPSNITFTEKIFPIRIPKKEEATDEHVGDNVVVAGWGQISNDDSGQAVAHKMNATVISNEECRLTFPDSSVYVTNGTMCTDGAGPKGICQYDYGAPMNYYVEKDGEWSVIGLAATNYIDCKLSLPSVYYRLGDPSVLDWIESLCGPTGLQKTPEGPPIFSCPSSSGIFPDPEDCRNFYQCAKGNPTSYTCPGNMVFNTTLGVCDFPENYP